MTRPLPPRVATRLAVYRCGHRGKVKIPTGPGLAEMTRERAEQVLLESAERIAAGSACRNCVLDLDLAEAVQVENEAGKAGAVLARLSAPGRRADLARVTRARWITTVVDAHDRQCERLWRGEGATLLALALPLLLNPALSPAHPPWPERAEGMRTSRQLLLRYWADESNVQAPDSQWWLGHVNDVYRVAGKVSDPVTVLVAYAASRAADGDPDGAARWFTALMDPSGAGSAALLRDAVARSGPDALETWRTWSALL